MSYYLQSLVEQMTDTPTWGWMITQDVFNEQCAKDGLDLSSSAGVTGPGRAPDSILEELERMKDGGEHREGFHSATFVMFDDDGELMARGRLVWTGEAEPDEDAIFAPLFDYGRGCWGCTTIEYDDHPAWRN